MIAFPNANVKANSIPADDAFAKNSLLSHERNPSTDNTITTNTQVQAVFQTIRVAVACHLRDREAMEDGCFCEAATCEISIPTAITVSHIVTKCRESIYGAYCITK